MISLLSILCALEANNYISNIPSLSIIINPFSYTYGTFSSDNIITIRWRLNACFNQLAIMVLYFFVGFRKLSNLTGDLSQDEKKINVDTSWANAQNNRNLYTFSNFGMILAFSLHRQICASECTLPRKILLCPINWGTQWTMEISSSE